MSSQNKRLITCKDVAGWIGWDLFTVYKKLYSRKLPFPFIRIKGPNKRDEYRFDPKDIEKWLENSKVQPGE